MKLSFDDVLLTPQYSTVVSRKDVSTISYLAIQSLRLPIISSNMDTVTGSTMANAMKELGGIGCLHRFQTIEQNLAMYKASHPDTWSSFGIGRQELERMEALLSEGCESFVLDVAHGSSQHVVEAVKAAYELTSGNAALIVGNFATAQNIRDFNYHLGFKVDAYKVGIGGGSVCTTRIVTGSGWPTLASLLDIKQLGLDVICDGGIRNSGDYSKAMAAGAKACMIGRLFAATDESPSNLVLQNNKYYKPYRGSASAESYAVQGKTSEHRSPEGESTLVEYTGSLKNTIDQLQAGLRSAMSYTGAHNLSEFVERAEFVQVTLNGVEESLPHGKTHG